MMPYMNEIINLCEKENIVFFKNESLKNYTTFKIGGSCKILISVDSEKSISQIISFCNKKNIKYAIIGNGSNILVSDLGYDGIIMYVGKHFSKVNLLEDNIIECQSGITLSKLCSFALENNLSGLEFAWGIPGTAGGAVYMNAGAYGGEMSDVVEEVTFFDGEKFKTLKKDELNFSYRHSFFTDNDYTISKIKLRLKIGNYDDIKSKMDELMQKRIDKQPLDYPSAGSTFKRPQGAFASALIEQCGLKGCCVGGAEVSTKHSGFLINKNNATFEDVINLVDVVKAKVKNDTGYELELEPKILN